MGLSNTEEAMDSIMGKIAPLPCPFCGQSLEKRVIVHGPARDYVEYAHPKNGCFLVTNDARGSFTLAECYVWLWNKRDKTKKKWVSPDIVEVPDGYIESSAGHK